MSTRTYNRVILVVNTSKILLLLFSLLFIKCNNFYMHIPSGNQLMLRRLMCLNKGLSINHGITLIVIHPFAWIEPVAHLSERKVCARVK